MLFLSSDTRGAEGRRKAEEFEKQDRKKEILLMIRQFLATTGQGLARAEYTTSTEWSIEFLLLDQDVRCLVADPLNSNVVYAGTQGNGVLRSSDRGKTWRLCGLPGQMVKALAVSSTAPG